MFLPTPNLKIVLPPTPTPNASQCNIGCVGSPMQNIRVGHIHFMLFVLISFALVTQREPSLQWNISFTFHVYKSHLNCDAVVTYYAIHMKFKMCDRLFCIYSDWYIKPCQCKRTSIHTVATVRIQVCAITMI